MPKKRLLLTKKQIICNKISEKPLTKRAFCFKIYNCVLVYFSIVGNNNIQIKFMEVK